MAKNKLQHIRVDRFGRAFAGWRTDGAWRLKQRLVALALGLGAVCLGTAALRAGTIAVPNGSFESPNTDFALPWIDAWSDATKPVWFEETDEVKWDRLTGVFANPAPDKDGHIDNCDGRQGAFLFAMPEAALFQDYTSTDWAHSMPTHAFDAKYEVGKSYLLTVGLIGGGAGSMVEGATLELSLYYRDAASNQVTVATTTVTYTPALFPTMTHFVDFAVRTPAVKAEDAWAGQNIGIRIRSTVPLEDPARWGGYWDLDHVRLTDAIEIPNGSFESPNTDFALPWIDAWSDATKPVWFEETDEVKWDNLTGVFANPAPDKDEHIDNCDGRQGAFLFAMPEAAIFQDYTSTDWAHSTPTHAFNAKFEAGKSYRLTVGVIGGGAGSMVEGATLELGLYYRDAASNQVTVATTTVTYTPALFPSMTHFVDFEVRTPAVKAGDAWAGKNIGIRLLSTVPLEDPARWGGYWDLDRVRLAEAADPVFALSCTTVGPDVRVAWPSSTGYAYQVKVSDDLKTWSDQGTPLAGTGGELVALVPKVGRPRTFVRVLATRTP